MDDRRMLAEGLVVLGGVVIMIGLLGPMEQTLFVLPGIAAVAAGAWLRDRSAGGVDKRKWPRWLVSSCAALILVCLLPGMLRIPSREILGALKGFVLPPIIVMILGAYGLFSATFLISIWIFILSLFSMEGAGPVGQLRLALAATICIVPIILGIIRVSRLISDTQTIPSGRSPLHIAAQNGKLEVVQKIVEQGADVDGRM